MTYSELAGLEGVRRFIERHVMFVLKQPTLSALYAQEMGHLAAADEWRRSLSTVRRANLPKDLART